jgi:hypothetical protein
MILMAPKGQRLTQMPHPMQRLSASTARLDARVTSMQSLPVALTGHLFLHSSLHSLGLHLASSTIATRPAIR